MNRLEFLFCDIPEGKILGNTPVFYYKELY